MPLPKWSELSPLTRRSKRKRYEMVRTKINVLEEDLEALQEAPESPDDEEDEDNEEG